MSITGLNHVALAVQDSAVYANVVDFYVKTLGLRLIRRWGNPPKHITMLDMGNCVLEIVFGAAGAGEGAFPHIAFGVERPEDVDAMLSLCAAAGCAITRPAGDLDKYEDLPDGPDNNAQGAPFRLRNGFCLGPAGESLEFFCQRP